MTSQTTLRHATITLAAFALLSGCVDQHHLIGETPLPDAGDASQGPSGGSAGTPATATGGSGGGQPGGTGATGGAPATSLGDEVSQGWPLQISATEVARRLSQFMLQQPPSDALTAAVVAAAPKTNQDVGQLADGFLLRDDSLAGRQAFYRWWLQLDAVLSVPRDEALFPLFTPAVRQALIDQTLAFTEDVTWRPGGDLATLLTDPSAYVSADTASWFPGVVAPATRAPAMRVALDGTRYAGLVTQPSLLATGSITTRTEPSRRGYDLRRRFLCQIIPPEPNVPIAMVVPMGETIREAITNSVDGTGPACTACHKLVDWPGFAFGHFDAVGSYQDTENGLPVDTSGVLQFNDGSSQAFAGAADLAAILAALPDTTSCFALKWLAFAAGTYPNPDQALLPASEDIRTTDDLAYLVARATIDGHLNLRATIRAVTETHTFLDP